jgi:hypothetical protein
MKTSTLLLAFLLSASFAWGQRVRPAGQHQADDAEAQFEKSIPPPVHQPQRLDFTRVRQNANELASLAQTIPTDVDQTTKGILPKDLNAKLKRIEKLAKQLRSQMDH